MSETIRRRILVILLIIGVPAAFLAYSAAVSSVVGILTIGTDKSAYQEGEKVTFVIRNNGFGVLEFGNPGLGLAIMNVDTGKFVNTGRFVPQVMHIIQPLQSETTEWDGTELTRNEMGQIEYRSVEPGNYVASVRTAGGFEPKAMAEVSFVIG